MAVNFIIDVFPPEPFSMVLEIQVRTLMVDLEQVCLAGTMEKSSSTRSQADVASLSSE